MPQIDLGRALAHALDSVLWARDELDLSFDPWQEDVLRADGDQLLCVTRQGGKSRTVAVKALHHLLFVPDAMVVVASPTETQSLELFRRLTGFLDRLKSAPATTVRNQTEIEFATGARICAVPGSERTIRSKSAVTLAILDEASRIDEGLIGAISPMLATTSGQLVALSSPFGRRGWFYETWIGGGAYTRTLKTADDCPRISRAFLEKERSRLGPMMFEQEYFCRFLDPGDTAFSSELIDACLDDFPPFP
jgi:hypothetical protein